MQPVILTEDVHAELAGVRVRKPVAKARIHSPMVILAKARIHFRTVKVKMDSGSHPLPRVRNDEASRKPLNDRHPGEGQDPFSNSQSQNGFRITSAAAGPE